MANVEVNKFVEDLKQLWSKAPAGTSYLNPQFKELVSRLRQHDPKNLALQVREVLESCTGVSGWSADDVTKPKKYEDLRRSLIKSLPENTKVKGAGFYRCRRSVKTSDEIFLVDVVKIGKVFYISAQSQDSSVQLQAEGMSNLKSQLKDIFALPKV